MSKELEEFEIAIMEAAQYCDTNTVCLTWEDAKGVVRPTMQATAFARGILDGLKKRMELQPDIYCESCGLKDGEAVLVAALRNLED